MVYKGFCLGKARKPQDKWPFERLSHSAALPLLGLNYVRFLFLFFRVNSLYRLRLWAQGLWAAGATTQTEMGDLQAATH